MKNYDVYITRLLNEVKSNISPRDEMFNYIRTRMPDDASTLKYYFDTGKELAIHLIDYLLQENQCPENFDVLDFAAGYGRVTRWFAPVFRSVTVADLEQDMVDFQCREYGVKGFVSGANFESLLTHEDNYDLVFVFSLFTHLPDQTWSNWLQALSNLVRPGGYLVFSSHSYELFAQLNPAKFGDPATWSEEFLFWETNETNGRLETSVYGCNIVKESYVRRAVSDLKGFKFEKRFEKGAFDRYHDIYVIKNVGIN